jgi:hypothetical protein
VLALLAGAIPAARGQTPPASTPADTSATSAAADTVATAPADSSTAAEAAPATSAATADTASLAAAERSVREEVDVWSSGVSPSAAVLVTPLFPGWGQLYSDSTWRGALAFGFEMFYWANLLQRDRKARRIRDHAETLPDGPQRDSYDDLAEEYWEQMRDFAWWSGGVLLIVALDAYVGAHLFRFEEDPLPVPDRWDDHFGPGAPEPPGSTAAPNVVVFRWRTRF